MVTAVLSESSEGFSVEVSGHSGMKGQSLVCAGVSALVESWRLAELHLEGLPSETGGGFIRAFAPKTDTSRVLFFQLVLGLKALERQYPLEIKIHTGGHHGI